MICEIFGPSLSRHMTRRLWIACAEDRVGRIDVTDLFGKSKNGITRCQLRSHTSATVAQVMIQLAGQHALNQSFGKLFRQTVWAKQVAIQGRRLHLHRR